MDGYAHVLMLAAFGLAVLGSVLGVAIRPCAGADREPPAPSRSERPLRIARPSRVRRRAAASAPAAPWPVARRASRPEPSATLRAPAPGAR